MTNKKLRKKIGRTRNKLADITQKLQKLEAKQARRIEKKAARVSEAMSINAPVN